MTETALIIASIQPGGQAESLGLRAADRIRSLGGREIGTNAELSRGLAGARPVTLRVERAGDTGAHTLEVELGAGLLGMTCVERALPAPLVGQPEPDVYAVGRRMATLTAGMGWLIVGVGLLIALASLFTNASPLQQPASLFLSGLMVAATGVILLLVAHAARALFDTADHARNLRERFERPPVA